MCMSIGQALLLLLVIMSSCYQFTHAQRGIALIIGNGDFAPSTGMDYRPGMLADVNRCTATFEKMGFLTIVLLERTCAEIRTAFITLETMDHSNFDCVCIVLSSHGTSKIITVSDFDVCEEYIYGMDGCVRIADLMKSLKEDRCPTLAGKPKLVFVQACRGNRLCESVTLNEVGTASAQSNVTHFLDADLTRCTISLPVCKKSLLQRDMLVMYASPPGYYAFHTDEGSPFLTILCDVLEKSFTKVDLLTMLTEVNLKVATEYESRMPDHPHLDKRRVVPSIEQMLLDEVFFGATSPPSKESATCK